MLWVWFSYCFEGGHREVAFQRPLLAAPQCYLRRQRRRARLVGEDPHHPRPPLYLLEQTLQHVRRAYPYVVASGVAQVGKGITDPCLKHRNRLRKTLAVELEELPGQGLRRLLAPDLEDGLQILGDLRHRGGRHVREHVALEMDHAPLPPYSRQLTGHRRLYPLVVV